MKNKKFFSSISHSAFRDYVKCPRLYYYRRVAKLKLPFEPIQLVFGKSLHLALELFVKDKRDPLEVFDKDFVHEKVSYLPLATFKEHKENGLRLLKFWKENQKEILALNGFGIKETEIPFELTVERDPVSNKVLNLPPIKGVVDFTTTPVIGMGDYKTSTKKYSQQDVDTSDQPTFYSLWHLLVKGTLPKHFWYIIFLKNHKRIPVQILKTTRTMKDVSKLLSEVQAVAKKIRNYEFDGRHKEGEFCDCHLYDELLSTRYVKKSERKKPNRFRSR